MRAFTLNTFISHIAVNQSTLILKCIKYDIYNFVICTRLAQGIGQPSVCRIYFGVDRYRARNCRGGYRTIFKTIVTFTDPRLAQMFEALQFLMFAHDLRTELDMLALVGERGGGQEEGLQVRGS